MRTCPQCRTQYTESDIRVCPKDATRLMSAKQFASAEADPLRGIVVAGRYKIIWRIGIGGMGTVYRAEQSGLDRPVALKILKRELIADRETVKRFEREAKATSLLVHPNTVRVFDYGETPDGLLFLAMELLEGDLLSHRLEGGTPLELPEAVSVCRQILHSLAEAHSKGIIHRDLKPDNIFLMRVDGRTDPVVKVLDFGIAKIVQGDRQVDQLETQAGTVFGTPRYMSPEQAQGKPLDARSDLYAVGVLLYQALTGRALFIDDDAVVVMAKHIKERPIPPRKVAPERRIPVSLERVVLKALEKDAKHRFSSAEEFDAALQACSSDIEAALKGPVSGRPSAHAAGAGARATTVVSVAVLVAALVVAAYVIMSKGGRRTHANEVTAIPIADSGSTRGPTTRAALVGSVLLRSEPFGAEVVRDGTFLGTTPIRVPVPTSGDRVHVLLRAPGYADTEADLSSSDPTPLITLSPAAGSSAGSSSRVEPNATRRPRGAVRDGAVDPASSTSPASTREHATPGPDAGAASATGTPPANETPANDPYERLE